MMLAKAAGLEIGESWGVRCSSVLETSTPGIYAAGDMCEYESLLQGRPIRIEHWDVAFNYGKTVALNMLGRGVEHDTIPYFFSDSLTGPRWSTPGLGRCGDPRFALGRRVHGVLLDGGRVTAALTVGRSDDLEHARRFLRERSRVDAAALADTGSTRARCGGPAVAGYFDERSMLRRVHRERAIALSGLRLDAGAPARRVRPAGALDRRTSPTTASRAPPR